MRTCGLSLPTSTAVFVRRDVEDESMEVEVTLDAPPPPRHSGKTTMGKSPDLIQHMVNAESNPDSDPEVDAPIPHRGKAPTAYSTPAAPAQNRAPPPPRSARQRHRALPSASSSGTDISRPIKRSAPAPSSSSTPPPSTPKATTSTSKASSKPPKPKPETYKQAWSVEEQHLLEQLLEEIPEGEKFRWQKISKAMGGKRTPRQVASRVQKYFEKLKRFGLG